MKCPRCEVECGEGKFHSGKAACVRALKEQLATARKHMVMWARAADDEAEITTALGARLTAAEERATDAEQRERVLLKELADERQQSLARVQRAQTHASTVEAQLAEARREQQKQHAEASAFSARAQAAEERAEIAVRAREDLRATLVEVDRLCEAQEHYPYIRITIAAALVGPSPAAQSAFARDRKEAP